MIFLASLLAAFLFVLAVFVLTKGQIEYIVHFGDPTTFLFILSGIAGYVLLFGRKKFVRGMKSFFAYSFPPDEESIKAGQFFLHLTKFTVRWALFGMFCALALMLIDLNPEKLGPHVVLMLLGFLYASGLAVFVFLPIGLRLAPTETRPSTWKLAVNLSLSAIAIFFLVRFMTFLSDFDPDSLGKFFSFHGFNFAMIWLFVDIPSIVMMIGSWWIFRLAEGRKIEATLAVPVIILIGIFWSILGLVLLLSNFAPDTFGPGFSVGMIPMFYAFLAAAGFLVADMVKSDNLAGTPAQSPALSSDEIEQAKKILDSVVDKERR